MKAFASALSEVDMKNVAAFYTTKQAKPGFAKNKDLVTLGEKIWRGGIADKQVPACAGCHGPAGAGLPAQYPRLGGQHQEYVQPQLVLFRAGKRANSPQMTAIASRMSDAEMAAVSDYIEGLK
jgi:cytochrome c553